MNKTAVVTGASRGIGREIALKLASLGCRVAVNYNKSESDAKKVCEEIKNMGMQAVCIKADVSDYAQVREMFSKIEKLWGGADILINNAGISCDMMLCDTTPDIWDKVMGINAGGIYNCSKAAAEYMVSKKWGRIVNVSSIWGMCGAACEVAYSASKAAVIGFTKALAKELGPSGITVNCIAPGVIDTDMNKNLSIEDIEALKEQTPLGVIGNCAAIADAAAYFVMPSGDFVTGQVLSPNGGFVI